MEHLAPRFAALDAGDLVESMDGLYPEEYLLFFTRSRPALAFAARMEREDRMGELAEAYELLKKKRVKEALSLVVGPSAVPPCAALDEKGGQLDEASPAGSGAEDQDPEEQDGEYPPPSSSGSTDAKDHWHWLSHFPPEGLVPMWLHSNACPSGRYDLGDPIPERWI